MGHWALVVGINQYQFFQPLRYAQRDAQAIHSLLIREAEFSPNQCILLTDNSPNAQGRLTYPNRDNLQFWLEWLRRSLQPDDSVWIFFSGYGVTHQAQDYLMPMEGNPGAVEATGIPIAWLFNQLRVASVEKVLVLFDISRCQSSLSNQPVGLHTAQLAHQTEIPTLLSCQVDQFSQEVGALGHGLFTAALIESLHQPECTTLKALHAVLQQRALDLSEQHWHPAQSPMMVASIAAAERFILPHFQSKTTPAALFSANGNASTPDPTTLSPAMTRHGAEVASPQAEEVTTSPSGAFLQQQSVVPAIAHDFVNGNGHGNRQPPASIMKNIPPNSSPTPVMSSNGAPPPKPQDTYEVPDAVFWPPFLMRGGIFTAILLTGVLMRHWSALVSQSVVQPPSPQSTIVAGVPKPPTANVINPSPAPTAANGDPAPVASPSPVATTPIAAPQTTRPSPPVSTSPNPGQRQPVEFTTPVTVPSPQPTTVTSPAASLLMPVAKAKVVGKSKQASAYSEAIQVAQRIPSTSSEYAEATQAIAQWSQSILTIAQERARAEQQSAAITAAILIPQGQPVSAKAQTSIDNWCDYIRPRRARTSIQKQADAICRVR